MDASGIAFYLFAAVTVVASLGVVGQRNPMYSVMLLITSFGALAGLYVLLDAPFTAVTQIIIYAGAIMVLFLFVVMLLNVPREEPAPPGLVAAFGPGTLKIAVVLSVVLGIEVVWALSRVGLGWFAQDAAATSVSSVSRIGVALFTRHAFAFEATSILILVAMVGAIVIARKER
jgi:NADH-quinone oxidoreductase subunit J